jgi:hypothetical protein
VKACWVDAGNDVNYDKFRQYGITIPYFDPRDPRITADYLDRVVAHPGIEHAGIYTAWNWSTDFVDPASYAEWTNQELIKIGWRGNARVCLNIETHDVNWILAALKRWRQLRPTRLTDWTLEGMQGGLFSTAAAQTINGYNIRPAPQFYIGNMQPQPHSVVLDLTMSGFDCSKVIGMYDAAALPYRWTGYAYTQGRLP